MASDRRQRLRDQKEADEARKALDWVLGRLTVLEYLILFFAMALALLGGALVAWLVSASTTLSFRWSWAVASLLLFILPGTFVYLREFRPGGRGPGHDPKSPEHPKKESNG
jgi:hypothetical protein